MPVMTEIINSILLCLKINELWLGHVSCKNLSQPPRPIILPPDYVTLRLEEVLTFEYTKTLFISYVKSQTNLVGAYVCMYAFMYVRMRSSVPTPVKYLDLVGAYVCMYVRVCM